MDSIVGSTVFEYSGRSVVVVPTALGRGDYVGAFKARVGFGRMDYRIEAGLYAVGRPTGDSAVLVTANYKLTFDSVRKELGGLDAWIVALDTDGINVWCAAGKGSFGTEELVNRIGLLGLDQLVNHRRLIVPQLGAPGVAAHEVKKQSGFTVIYGPIRAADIKAFLDADCEATAEMRQVRFSFVDRLILTPIELDCNRRYLLFAMALLAALSPLGRGGYRVDMLLSRGLISACLLLIAYTAGAVAGPALLPWLPGRSFSGKGAAVGIGVAVIACLGNLTGPPIETAAWVLMSAAVASFMTANFTGASTYTSQSGVKKEMRIAVPMQIAAAAVGLILFVIAGFFRIAP